MPMIDAKLNEVDAWGGESTQLPPGPYSFRIKSASIESKAEGKNQLVVENEVISSGEMKGKTAKSFFMLDFSKDAPRKRLKSLVLATKVPVDAAGNFNSDNLVGTQYDAEVTHESYESKPDPLRTRLRPRLLRVLSTRCLSVRTLLRLPVSPLFRTRLRFRVKPLRSCPEWRG